jgi:tetratricopeptide (TPR) repeat protein
VEAVKEGVRQYRRFDKKVQYVDVQKGWTLYPPVALPPVKWIVKAPEERNERFKELKKDFLSAWEQSYKEAVKRCMEKLKKNPKDHKTRNTLGVFYAKRGNFKEAEKHFNYNRMHVFKPGYADCYINLGNIYLMQMLYGAACLNYEKAIKKNPKEGGTYFNLGILHFLKGQERKALKFFAKSFSLYPTLEDAFIALGLDIKIKESLLRASPQEISKSEVERLLKKALKKVPLNSQELKKIKETLTALAGVRGERGELRNLAHILYWKE